MRTLRLSLVGTIILVLLGGLGGTVVLAQDEDQAGPVVAPLYSTGTFELIDGGEGQFSKVGDVIQERGAFIAYEGEASDPRASGYMTVGVSGSWFSAGSPSADTWVFSAIARLENADGAWEGPVSGIAHPTGFTSVGWLTGEEDYEGLTMFIRGSYDGTTAFGENLVFAGDPPTPNVDQ
jgi:hypothetical protein